MLLVQVEHVIEVHPVGNRREILLNTVEAVVVALVFVTTVTRGEVGVVPVETISSNY